MTDQKKSSIKLTMDELVKQVDAEILKNIQPVIFDYPAAPATHGGTLTEKGLKDMVDAVRNMTYTPSAQPYMRTTLGSQPLQMPSVTTEEPLSISKSGFEVKAMITHEVDRTLAELIEVINDLVGVDNVQTVYDMAPDVAIVITPQESFMDPWNLMSRVAVTINNTFLTDYENLEWTFRGKGVKKFDHSIPRPVRSNESNVQQSRWTKGDPITSQRLTERYGVGVINSNGIARAGAISTD